MILGRSCSSTLSTALYSTPSLTKMLVSINSRGAKRGKKLGGFVVAKESNGIFNKMTGTSIRREFSISEAPHGGLPEDEQRQTPSDVEEQTDISPLPSSIDEFNAAFGIAEHDGSFPETKARARHQKSISRFFLTSKKTIRHSRPKSEKSSSEIIFSVPSDNPITRSGDINIQSYETNASSNNAMSITQLLDLNTAKLGLSQSNGTSSMVPKSETKQDHNGEGGDGKRPRNDKTSDDIQTNEEPISETAKMLDEEGPVIEPKGKIFSTIEKTEEGYLKNMTFTYPANQTIVANLLNLYSKHLDQQYCTQDERLNYFLKSLRLLFYLYKPTLFSLTTIFNISRLKGIAANASPSIQDVSFIFPLDRMLPSCKAFQESRTHIPVEVHVAMMKITEKMRANHFAYEYFLEFIMRDSYLCVQPTLILATFKALSSHQFALISIFEHFLKSGGVATPALVAEILAIPTVIDSSYLFESYYERYIKIPYLEQRLHPTEKKKIEDHLLVQATKSILGMYARGSNANQSYFQLKVNGIKNWVLKYAPHLNPSVEAICKEILKEKLPPIDDSLNLD